MANQPSKYSKFLIGAASAALVASAVAPVASAADFTDTKGNTHEEAINALVAAGIANGYKDGSFKPNKELTRADVVKFLGKWLVSQGKEIPSDAVSNPRFKDLKPTTEKELLEYAAVAYDNGVFNGSNGNLLPSDKMTRQNMANVIVRAFDNVNGFDLVEYVESQTDFKGDVKDLSAAYEDTKGAIKVVDFFDITNPDVANFRPKDATTRGQFASFLNRALDTDFSAVSVGAVKAINATTVEVTYKDAQKDVKAADFTIEGLTVSDATVKQTNDKVVVLTTSKQEGNKEYTLKSGETKLGTFKGVSAVVPSAINVSTASVQGVIGKEVTVSAQVTVAEGQSKAGIPVTFNIVSEKSDLNSKIEVEAITNADGVASHSYTRYYSHNDNVAAYATEKSSVVSNGKVYWSDAIQLAVSELTTGNELANETKKSYKVAGDADTTYYIAIKENLGVTPDKITQVKVQNYNTTATTTDDIVTPYTLSTSATHAVAAVRTNSNGEGTFTIYGTNLSATPIVYSPESTPTSSLSLTYTKLDLQAEAPTVKFSQVDRLALEVVAEGSANSAQYAATNFAFNANSAGGRTYSVNVKDKEGKIAPEGTKAYVTFEADNYGIATNGALYFSTGTNNFQSILNADASVKTFEVTVGKEGKAQFRVAGNGATTFAKPTVFLNTAGTISPAVLDKTDVQAVAEVTYFKAPTVTNALLTVRDENNRIVSSLSAGKDAYFTYQSVDQNGFAHRPIGYSTNPVTQKVWVPVFNADGTIQYYKEETITSAPGTSVHEYTLSFDVTSTFGNATVKGLNGLVLTPQNQNLGNTKTYQVKSDAEGKAIILVTSSATDTVSVNVTGANNILPTQSATVSFVDSRIVPDLYSGNVASFNSLQGTLTFAGKNTVSLYGSNVHYSKGAEVIANYEAFVELLKDATGTVSVTRTVKDGVTTFNIYNISTTGTKPVDTAVTNEKEVAKAALTTEVTNAKALDTTGKTAASALVLTNAITAAEAVLVDANATTANYNTARTAITAAITGLVNDTATVQITSATAQGFNALSSMLGSYDYLVEGTVGTEFAGETVTLNFANDTEGTVAEATVQVDAQGNFTYEIDYSKFFGAFNKVSAEVTKNGTTVKSAVTTIDVTEAE